MTRPTAQLIEIFSSLQGEGPYAGEPMMFVRFQHCALSCRYCDTPASFQRLEKFRQEEPWGSGRFHFRPNPLEAEELSAILETGNTPSLSLTGGEPLQHRAFLEHWLPQIQGRYRILLETNGVLPKELNQVLRYIDVVSMDLKLPSVTGMRAYWEEHREFLKIARGKEVYIKVVLSAPADLEEFRRAVSLVKEEAPQAPFILQPVTPFGEVRETIAGEKLQDFYEFSQEVLSDVRVISQLHPRLGIC